MLDNKKITYRYISSEELDKMYKDSLNTPLDEELIEIVKALADK